MSAVRVAGIAAATLFAGAVGFAQTDSTQISPDTNQAIVKGNTITVVGCLMKESDYRRAHGFGKGAFNGAGLGDEYVIVDSASCADTALGVAYRPTGPREHEMKPFLGQRVEVTGKLTDNGSAAARAEEGKLPPEIRVASFGAAPAPVAQQAAAAPAPAAPVTEPAPEPAPAPALEAQNTAPTPPATENAPAASTTQPVGTSGRLPKTAGEEPLIGLIGFGLIAAGLSLKLLRRATA